MTSGHLAVMWDPRFRAYDFGPGHPFNETSREFAVRLLESSLTPAQHAAIHWNRTIDPAAVATLRSFHDADYIEFVRAASDETESLLLDALDTPSFPGCFEAAARIAAGTLEAARWAMGDGRVAFAPAGGLHHAGPKRAGGFCIFNDVAIGIAAAREAGHRIAYVDLDAHHGDGVMYGFYRDGHVLDIDFHQDGRTLFPGSGFPSETGKGDGAGLKVNVPLPPGAGDEALVPLARRLLPRMFHDFRPDLLVVQHGVDGHWGDPLAQLQFTPRGYAEVDRLLIGLAAEFGGRILITGGGGYEVRSAARALARSGRQYGGLEVPADDAILPESWRTDFAREFGVSAPERWADPPRLPRSPWGPAAESELIDALESALGRRFPPAPST
jgi:acetoin utilization protein AcuC